MSTARSPYTAYSAVDIEKGAASYDFADSIIRQGFVRKVFGLLAVQLALTVVIGGSIFGSASVKAAVFTNPIIPIMAMVMSLGSLVYMMFSEKARHQFPTNLVLLGTFTLGEGVLVGMATCRYNTDVVLLAMGITAAVTLALCLYALTTKSDFTGMGPWMYAGLMSLMVASFVGIMLRTPVFTLALSAGGAALFSMYIVYDVQMLMGGQHQCKVSPDEYVFAAINIYLDIINLFLYILRIVNAARGDN